MGNPTRTRPLRSPRRQFVGVGVVIAVVLAASAAAIATASGDSPTKGRVPQAAMQAGAPLDLSRFPDFVAASDRQGNVVGYVPKGALAPPAGPASLMQGVMNLAPIPVYAADLSTLVGHMYPDKGFVALGIDPATVSNVTGGIAP